jgi:hypothetical protein
MTDLMPIPFDDSEESGSDHTLHVELEDERLRRSKGTKPE